MDTLKQKRQYFHQLLIRLGEVKYKELIIEAEFGVTSTKDITEAWKMDKLIADAQNRLEQNNQSAPQKPKSDKQLRLLRNKCLQVLNQRGIAPTPKNWQPVNEELAKKQYQWVMRSGLINRKGLYAFSTVPDLRKLFHQLSSIRDNEIKKGQYLNELASKN